MIARASSFSPRQAAGLLLPFFTIIAAMLMMPLPMGLPLFGQSFMPNLPLLTIFLWTLYRPDLLPPFVVLALGVLADLLMRGPLGVSCLVFLAGYGITISQRVYWAGLKGLGLINGFLFVAFTAELLSWGANSFAHGHLLSPLPAIVEGAASIVFLPLARAVFGPFERLAGPGGV